jgi:hypothetical protein
MLNIDRGVRLMPSACEDGLAVYMRIDACKHSPHRYLRLADEHRIPEGLGKVKQKNVIFA